MMIRWNGLYAILGQIFICIYISGATGLIGEVARKLTPSIETQSNTYDKPIGEEVLLKCRPQNIGSYIVLWKRGDLEVLSAGRLLVKPDHRLSLVEYNLRIKDVRPEDAGQYTCYVSTNGPTVSVTHNLQILVPPSILPEPGGERYVMKKGSRVDLRCSATGNPAPDIKWTRKDGRLPGGMTESYGPSLSIFTINKGDAGVYLCSASNGIGAPAHAEINLEVLYPPEVVLETGDLHSVDRKEARISCIARGNPTPRVHWYKESSLLFESSSVTFLSTKDRHTLLLREIEVGRNLGNYSCVAENDLGTFKKHIEVHGRPSSPVFQSDPSSDSHQDYILSWTVKSYSPIEEHRLLYRKIKPYHGAVDSNHLLSEGDWTNVIISGDANNPGVSHNSRYKLTGLEEESEYECLVQARNRFGWSEPSRLFTFFTSKPVPAAHDLQWRQILNQGSRLDQLHSSVIVVIMPALMYQIQTLY